MRAAGIEPHRVVVEVTERYGGRTASVLKSLRRRREQGFKLALDDVGAGNSGLETLREVGAEFVKLDRSIVVAAPEEANARDAATMIPGGQGYGLGRPAPEVPAAGARRHTPAPTSV